MQAAARGLAAALEEGRLRSGLARAASVVWGRVSARAVRADAYPVPSVAVMGATLGGSWKTPVAVALARALAGRGVAVGFCPHPYRTHVDAPRLLRGDEPPSLVGDEALLAARALSPLGVRVALARRRRDAAALLPADVELVVLDAVTRPWAPGAPTLLALDAAQPFGAGRPPPAGDLRMERSALLALASHVVLVRDELAATPSRPPEVPAAFSAVASVTVPEVAYGARVALVTTLARPGRVRGALERRGVRVARHVALPDHGGPWVGASAARALGGVAFDVVVATEKCRTWLPSSVRGRDVVTLGLDVTLPDALVDALLSAGLDQRRSTS